MGFTWATKSSATDAYVLCFILLNGLVAISICTGVCPCVATGVQNFHTPNITIHIEYKCFKLA